MTDNNVIVFPTPRPTIPANGIAIGNMLVEQEMVDKDGLITFTKPADTVFGWNGCKYVPREKNHIQNRIIHMLNGAWMRKGKNEVPFELSPSLLSIAIKTVEERIGRGLDYTRRLPQWRDNNPFDDDYIMPFKNGIVHLLTGKAVPCTPAYVNLHCADYVYDPTAVCDEWRNNLPVWFGSDHEAIDALQEAMGLSLVPDFRHERMACLIGPPGTGKRMIAMVLTHLRGIESVASATIQSVAGNFGFENWDDRAVAIFRDARISSGRLVDIQSIISMLLSIISHEPIPLNRKNRKIKEAMFDTHVWYFSNEVPFFADNHLAMARRYLIIVMKNWLKEEGAPAVDLNLLDRLMGELPGILNWALVGLKRLRERGNFIQPESGLRVLNDIRYKSCPEMEFVDNFIRFGKGKYTEMEMLRSQYYQWCNRMEVEVKEMKILSRRIQQDHPEVMVVRGKGNYVEGYSGFELVNEV